MGAISELQTVRPRLHRMFGVKTSLNRGQIRGCQVSEDIKKRESSDPNVCVHPKFSCGNLITHGVVLGGGAFHDDKGKRHPLPPKKIAPWDDTLRRNSMTSKKSAPDLKFAVP